MTLLLGAGGGVIFATLLAVKDMPRAIMDWAQSLKDSQQHLMRFSHTLAEAFAESKIREVRRDFGSAQRTGGSTAELTDALDDLKDELQPFKDLATNAKNAFAVIGLRLTQFGIIALRAQTILDDILLKIQEFMAKGKGEVAPFELMESIRKLPKSLTEPPRPRK